MNGQNMGTADKSGDLKASRFIASLAELGIGEIVTVEEIVKEMGKHAQGLLMLVFAVPCCFPMLPGVPTICGIAITILSVQILAGKKTLLLPSYLLGKSIQRKDLALTIRRALPVLRRIEHFSRPREIWGTRTVRYTVTGFFGVICGVILVLPIPFVGNIPPGFAVAALALGLIERDDLATLVGALITILAVGLLVVLWWGALNGAEFLSQANHAG